MHRDNRWLWILGALLLLGMLLTALYGRDSRHGYGLAPGHSASRAA